VELDIIMGIAAGFLGRGVKSKGGIGHAEEDWLGQCKEGIE